MILFLVLLLFNFQALDGWHAYSNMTVSETCHHYYRSTFRHEKELKLWNNIHSDDKNKVTTNLYASEIAIKSIYKHQHPENCATAKFIISPAQRSAGFGSEIHVEGALLAFAMLTGRVLLDNPDSIEGMSKRFKNPFCLAQNKTNKECYYEPWSSCTIYDAIGDLSTHSINEVYNGKHIAGLDYIRLSRIDVEQIIHNKGDYHLLGKYSGAKVLIPYDIAEGNSRVIEITSSSCLQSHQRRAL
eukprot:gene14324-30496_t